MLRPAAHFDERRCFGERDAFAALAVRRTLGQSCGAQGAARVDDEMDFASQSYREALGKQIVAMLRRGTARWRDGRRDRGRSTVASGSLRTPSGIRRHTIPLRLTAERVR